MSLLERSLTLGELSDIGPETKQHIIRRTIKTWKYARNIFSSLKYPSYINVFQYAGPQLIIIMHYIMLQMFLPFK